MKKFGIWQVILIIFCTSIITYTITILKVNKDIYENDGYLPQLSDVFEKEDSNDENTFEKLSKVKAVLEKKYLRDFDDKTLVDGAINGMLEALDDPYTTYFNEEDAEQFLIETEGEYEGVGIYVSYDTNKKLVIVLTPIEGSPAAEAGLLPGDYIEFVDDKEVTSSTLEEVSDMLKGKANTKVKIGIVRYDEEGKITRLEKTLTRRKINIDPVVEKVYENNIGYIKLTSFDETTYDEFYDAYKDLIKKKNVEGLIIDLRNNPGGLLDVATGIADLLVPKGKIVYTVDKQGKQEIIYSNNKKIEIPLVVIINEGSASASEVLTGAIKDYGVGKIVGVNSYGKGVVQTLLGLKDGTYIKVTTNEYFSPNGNKIDGEGVSPDVEVKLPEGIDSYYNLEFDDDTQLQKAIEELKKMM